MGRNLRKEFYGAIYYIHNHGNNNEEIFKSLDDKMKLLNILGEIKELFDFYLIAYCIMDDNYHLLIKTHNISISRIMQRLNTIYAKYYNRQYNRTGPVFAGRYKDKIVDNENNLLDLINYVHNYPFYKNKVAEITEYKWNSDIFYRMNIESLVDISYVYDTLSDDRVISINKYKEFMTLYIDDYEQGIKLGGVERDRLLQLDQILNDICENKRDCELIKNGSRKAYLMELKAKFIEECLNNGFSIREIAQFISMSERGVRRHISSKSFC